MLLNLLGMLGVQKNANIWCQLYIRHHSIYLSETNNMALPDSRNIEKNVISNMSAKTLKNVNRQDQV